MNIFKKITSLIVIILLITACSDNEQILEPIDDTIVPEAILDQLSESGISTEGVYVSTFRGEPGYVVEGDIFLTEYQIAELQLPEIVDAPTTEQYRTSNLVTGLPRVITVWVDPALGRNGRQATNRAIRAYNNLNQGLTFRRVGNRAAAEIPITTFREPRRPDGSIVLGRAAGFPSAAGNPAPGFGINLTANELINPSVNDMRGTFIHEIGHCIGFRHTDFFNRGSCGQNVNEGNGGVGAIRIPGTPAGSDATSIMNACSGSSTTFNNNDRRAFRRIY